VRPTTVYIPKWPMRVTSDAVKHLSSLPQFHGIPDESLIRLAKRRTGLYVPDRWVAIALILGNRIPIPVPTPRGRQQVQSGVPHGSRQVGSDNWGGGFQRQGRRPFESGDCSSVVRRTDS